jgi:glyoxylase-like metal-dependent hydrolase (beta-lactamase superfamily II)
LIQIGDIEIHLVSDGIVHADGGGAFGLVPRAIWSKILEPDEDNLIPMALTCLLVRVDGKTIVVETGIGTKNEELNARLWRIKRPEGTLLEGLARHDVAPEDVDLVINTHLHSDHCAGNTSLVDGELVPTFPNAEYWVQRLEYADAAHPNERTRNTYFTEHYRPLYESGQMRLLNGDTPVVPGMRCVVTRGHTRAHQSIVFEQGDETVLFTADMATFSVHFERLAWVTAFDVEPLENIETKRVWRRWAAERDALVIFAHDPKVPAARLREKPDKPGSYYLVPEPIS